MFKGPHRFGLEKVKMINSHAGGMAVALPDSFENVFVGTLFLDQLHNFSLLLCNLFSNQFFKSEFIEKNSWHQK